MDVSNFGGTDLFLRLLFLELGMAGPVNGAFSSNAVFVPAGSGWQTVAFDVSAAALTPLLGSVSGALSNASELRIFHNPAPAFIPAGNPAIAANLGVDNITAAAIPEPGTWTLMAAGLVGLFVRSRCRCGTDS
jgi:hypothetical protein